MTWDTEEEWDLDFEGEYAKLTDAERAEWDAVATEFGDEAEPKKVALTKAQANYVVKHRMMTVRQLFELPPVDWFIQDLLPEAPRTILHGAGGSRKSFLMLDWALCAAHGLAWQGRAVKPGKVLYILGEGVQGLGKRLKAWAQDHDIDPEALQIDLMAVPINLWKLTDEQVANWAAVVAELGYDYIVIDTLHTAMAGGEESSSKDIGIVYENATQIAGSARLFFLHHDTKVGDSGRGSSAIRDDADVVISLAESGSRESKLTADKLRDADNFKPVTIHFEVVDTDLGSSLVVSAANQQGDTRPRERSAVDRCKEAIDLYGLDPEGSIAQVYNQLKANGYAVSKDTAYAAVKELRDSDAIILTD